VVVQQHSKKLGIVIMNEHIAQGGNDSNISGIILVQMKCGQKVYCVRHWKHEVKDFALKIVLRTKCVGLAR